MGIKTYISVNPDNTIGNVLRTNQGHPGKPYVEVTNSEDKQQLNHRPNRFLWVDGRLRTKPEVTLHLDKTLIEADGIDEAHLTMSGADSANVVVGGQSAVLRKDETITITSSEEKAVGIYVDDSRVYSESFLTVGARNSK